jgi:hypothetical protein
LARIRSVVANDIAHDTVPTTVGPAHRAITQDTTKPVITGSAVMARLQRKLFSREVF